MRYIEDETADYLAATLRKAAGVWDDVGGGGDVSRELREKAGEIEPVVSLDMIQTVQNSMDHCCSDETVRHILCGALEAGVIEVAGAETQALVGELRGRLKMAEHLLFMVTDGIVKWGGLTHDGIPERYNWEASGTFLSAAQGEYLLGIRKDEEE